MKNKYHYTYIKTHITIKKAAITKGLPLSWVTGASEGLLSGRALCWVTNAIVLRGQTLCWVTDGSRGSAEGASGCVRQIGEGERAKIPLCCGGIG